MAKNKAQTLDQLARRYVFCRAHVNPLLRELSEINKEFQRRAKGKAKVFKGDRFVIELGFHPREILAAKEDFIKAYGEKVLKKKKLLRTISVSSLDINRKK